MQNPAWKHELLEFFWVPQKKLTILTSYLVDFQRLKSLYFKMYNLFSLSTIFIGVSVSIGWLKRTRLPCGHMIWLLANPLSLQQVVSLSQYSCLSSVERGVEGGRGAKSYDRKTIWSSINHSILSAVNVQYCSHGAEEVDFVKKLNFKIIYRSKRTKVLFS